MIGLATIDRIPNSRRPSATGSDRKVDGVLEAVFDGDVDDAIAGVAKSVDTEAVVPRYVWDMRGSGRDDHDSFVPHMVVRDIGA
jgi:hypothetical protein